MTASFAQNSFLGGEWSPQMQGRFDTADYRQGMNLCLNIVPIEEGAAPRRSGTRLGGVTRSGAYGAVREYNVDGAQPFDLELTAGHLRIWRADAGLITEGPIQVHIVDPTNPQYFNTVLDHGFASGDQVIFAVGAATSYAGIDQVLGRQMAVIVSDPQQFQPLDALTGNVVDGTLIDPTKSSGLTVARIIDIATPYNEDELQDIRIVQDGADALLLHHNHPPQTFSVAFDASGNFESASLVPAVFHDGPFLDIPTDGTTLTPGSTSGSITFMASAITSINGGQGFLPSDVGRMFRVFSEPALWAAGTAYTTGAIVKEADVYWKNIKAGTGVQPSTDAGLNWVIDPTAAAWTWGTIQSISTDHIFVGTLAPAVTYPANTAGGNLLYMVPITAWQLGAYCTTTGYPSCGAYYQGRVWLGGAIKNRFDASVSNDFATNGYINFAPTGLDGTVADNNGIAGTLNAREIENFLWMLPDEQGVLAGTQSGEWAIASSSSGEPITPTSILTRETSHYGSADLQAIKIGRATIFVHRDTRKIYEYMANYFTQKFVADNLSLKAKHLTVSGIAELAYMRELAPVIWARRNDGTLIGCTYKHDDPIKPLEFSAWHRHQFGHGRSVISIQGGPANGGKTDTLSMITQDATTGFCFVEFLQTLWDDSDDLLTAWYVDSGVNPAAAERLIVDGAPVVRIYGLWYLAGQAITAWGAGLDLGDFTVTAGGTIDIPLNTQSSLFTDALLAGIAASGCTPLSTDIAGEGTVPTKYVMTAEENYDPAHVSYISGLATYQTEDGTNNVLITADQNYPGIQWDPVRRNLMYIFAESTPTSPGTNNTGYHLWDGASAKAPGDPMTINTQWNSSVGVKNIDTGKVMFYLNYNSANVVPSGIGGSDGTYRRFTNDIMVIGANSQVLPDTRRTGNGPGMTDPYTGNFWINGASCELYCFRLEDAYSQTISPLFPVKNGGNNVQPVGFMTEGGDWTFVREIDPATSTAYLYMVPREYTAAEITADYLLIYATYNYPTWVSTAPQNLFHVYNREVFDAFGNMFLFSCSRSGGKAFKLYMFTAPIQANYPTPAVGGGFTDITPWGAGTGPNADGASYTLARSTGPVETSDIIPMYLPATDDLVLIEKFLPVEHTAALVDPALMFWSCTYVNSPSGSPTFDHHSAFVTGYMTAGWAPTDINGAAYAVVDAFEVNSYLDQTDYLYNIDYTSRWFFFLCTRMVDGVSDGRPRIVLVNYRFTYGQAPVVVQVIDEQGWNDAYPSYMPSTDAYAPNAVVSAGAVAASMNTTYNTDLNYPLWDVGIHDPVTNSFWWSGGGANLATKTAFFGQITSEAIFCQFDPAYADRMQTADGIPRAGTIPAATPPFLKLSFGDGGIGPTAGCAPFAIGHTFTSRGQILRPASPQESMTQTGPSLGKKRRTTYAAPLLVAAQGVSMGVDFLKMRPLEFKSPGGTVAIPLTQTFSGVYWGTVDADSNYDNMWCWEITRPYPCTVVAVEVQHKVNENV